MTKLTSLLFSLFTITACAFDSEDLQKPAEPSPLELELADEQLSTGLVTSTDSHTCVVDKFVGCSGSEVAVFCGEDGRSLVTEDCAFGCGAEGCFQCSPGEPNCTPAGQWIPEGEPSKN